MPTVILSALRLSFAASRSRSSSAARTVKVTAVISLGFTPRSTSRTMRSTSVCVLPVPGPAITAVTRAPLSAAASCPAFSPRGCNVLSLTSCAFCVVLSALPLFFALSGAVAASSARGMLSKKESCPLVFFSSSGVNREILPYSPSNPADLITLPSRRRRIPSAMRSPAYRSMSAICRTRRISASEPRSRSILIYVCSVLVLAAPVPSDAAIASGRGMRCSNGFAPAGT